VAEVQPIIIKKKKGGHGAAHGGAWKVAYADFVTAMMCFFMVMWLMGSDEETKAAVADYFNNPTSAWRKDLTSQETMPLGDKTGAGDNIMKGADGQVPEDLVQRPQKPYSTPDTAEGAKAVTTLDTFMADDSIVKLDIIQLSIPEDEVFKPGSDQFAPTSEGHFKKLGVLLRKYPGQVIISTNHLAGGGAETTYEFQLARSVAVGRYFVEQKWASQDLIQAKVAEKKAKRDLQSGEFKLPPRRIELTLTRRPSE
jgi:flagellar motor protein MotB